MSIDYSVLPFKKPTPQKKLKTILREAYADRVARIRVYVFGRERGICRCCMWRRAESMHEIHARSVGGVVSKRNSIAVCGDGVSGCHGLLQRKKIHCVYQPRVGAEGALRFIPVTPSAAAWMRVAEGHAVESKPGSQREDV